MNLWKRFFPGFIAAAIVVAPAAARADWAIVDRFDLSPFVPLVLDSMMTVATGMYDFFVRGGTGIIYTLVVGFLVFTLAFGLLKMFMPKQIAGLFGISDAGAMANGIQPQALVQDKILKPAVRTIIALTLLLQIRPVYVTQWLINPFLQFGAAYTSAITDTINAGTTAAQNVECPDEIVTNGWLTKESCEFLVQPISALSRANNVAIKRGLSMIDSGLTGLMVLIPHGGADFLSLVSGTLVTATFFSSNLFMALLIIQAIFQFGMALALYPFSVLTYVVKPSNKWLDLQPAFGGIVTALQKLIITMIACAFILCINLAVIRALFNWNNSVFVVSAGGAATSNVPTISSAAAGFGGHSILWLSSILTLYLMFKIFELTRQQLDAYVGSGMDALYNQVKSDTNSLIKRSKTLRQQITDIAKKVKNK